MGIGPLDVAAIAAGKAAGAGTRLLRRGGGTALPGLVAERVSPRLLRRFARQLRQGALIVTGTNGKTTTSRMLGAILTPPLAGHPQPLRLEPGARPDRDAGAGQRPARRPPRRCRPVRGGRGDRPRRRWPRSRPRLILIHNLFRDQLDRYGEMDTIHRRWREALATLPARSTVVLNADDPSVAVLARHTRARVITYGVEDTRHALTALPHAADAINCPVCAHRLNYSAILLSHLGHYRCPQCGFARPPIDVAATAVALHGTDALTLIVSAPAAHSRSRSACRASTTPIMRWPPRAAALALGLPPATIHAGLREFRAAFGRIERVAAGDKQLLLALVKNPVGFNEVLRMLFPPRRRGGGRPSTC